MRTEWQVSKVELDEGQGMENVAVRSTMENKQTNPETGKTEKASELVHSRNCKGVITAR